MDPLDEEAFKDVNDPESARLALRGAVATVRNLQESCARLKGELQESVHGEKAAREEVAGLKEELLRWQDQAKKWQEERGRLVAGEENVKGKLRLEVREEERRRVDEERRRLEEEFSRLSAQVEEWKAVHRDKDDKWRELKRLLEARDAELLAAQREKIELTQQFHRDAQMLHDLRQKRDEEILSSIQSRERELELKSREIAQLKRQNDEFQRLFEVKLREAEEKLKKREEELLRSHRAQEMALQERYSQREAELQAAWTELENGLWQRTKEGREKLDQAIQSQFDERARALADRSKEIEELLEKKRKELEEEHLRRAQEAEARYAGDERLLKESWERKEAAFLKRFENDLSKEKEVLAAQVREQNQAAVQEVRAKMAELAHLQGKLETEFSERQAAVELQLAQRQRDLEDAARRREVALQEKHLALVHELKEEWAQRKIELLKEQEAASEQERASMQAGLAAKERSLEEAYQARLAELERFQKTLEQQFKDQKLVADSERLEREKSLDKQWFVREQELIRRYEIALDQQRRSAALELDKAKDLFERQLREARSPKQEGAG